MNVNHAIDLNVSATGMPPVLKMAQYDANSRTIVATLWNGASKFVIPSDASVMVRFGKPDGTGGLYDETEAGDAITFADNVVTAPVAAQMLSVAGSVKANIEIYQAGETEQAAVKLATFCFVVNVERAAYSDAEMISSDYYNIMAEQIQQAISAGQVAASAITAASKANSYASLAESAASTANSSASRLMESSKPVCLNQLGIKCDLDLRGSAEAGITESPLGANVDYVCAAAYNWYSITDKATWKQNLECIIDHVARDEPVYFHCTAGADRTGTLACVIEGLLGMSQSDIDKDYELTSFYSGVDTDANARRRNEAEWKGLIGAINALAGDTFRDKCVNFAVSCGIPLSKINAFRAAMIDGTPEEVTPAISTYTVASVLTNVTSDNAAAQAVQYQPYAAKITPASGYVINNVQIKMGGVDITSQVWDGNDTVLRRAVTLDLAHCSINNARTYVVDGQSYAAVIQAETGYTLDSAAISITMGGVDVATYYKDGVIAIPSVSGDLEIVVTAVPSATPVTNLAEELGVVTNNRISLTTGKNSAQTGWCAVGSDETKTIEIAAGDVIRIKGSTVSFPSASDNMTAAVYYNADGSHGTPTGRYLYVGLQEIFSVALNDDGVYEITCLYAGAPRIRLCFPCTDTGDLIVTKNQEIS